MYNHCLQYCIDHYDRNKNLDKDKQEKRPGAYDLQGLLPELKKKHEWLKEVDSQALKYSAKSVDDAFKNFFRRIKTGDKPGFPRFKSKHRSKPSFTLTQGQRIIYGEHWVMIPKIGRVRLDGSNFNPPTTESRVKRCTISRSASGNYYISILFSDDQEELEEDHNYDKITALDLGLKCLFKSGDNQGNKHVVESPKFFRHQLDRLAKEQKKLSKKTLKSGRWKKQKLKVARIHERITNSRRNFFHHVSNQLLNTNDAVVMENLDIRGMIEKNSKEEEGKKKHNINRAFYDQSLSELVRIIEYKSKRQGKPCYLVDTLRSPNKLCSFCDHINNHVTLETTAWKCDKCETEHERSENCLINLHRMASEMAIESKINQEENNK